MTQHDGPDIYHSKAQQTLHDRSCKKAESAAAIVTHSVPWLVARAVGQLDVTQDPKLYLLHKTRVTTLRTWQAGASTEEPGW